MGNDATSRGTACPRQQEPARGAGERHQQHLGEQLAHERPARRAERRLHRQLAPALDRAREQQARQVRAGDEQHHRHRRQQQAHGGRGVGDEAVGKAQGAEAVAFARVREPAREVRRHRREALLERRGRVAGAQQAERTDEAVAGRVGHRRAIGEPELGALREGEPGRHHAHDLQAPAVDHDGPTDDRGVGAVTAAPERVRQHDRGLGAPRGRIRILERTAQGGMRADQAEQARGDRSRHHAGGALLRLEGHVALDEALGGRQARARAHGLELDRGQRRVVELDGARRVRRVDRDHASGVGPERRVHEEDALDQAEHDRIGAESERQRQRHDGRQRRPPPDRPRRRDERTRHAVLPSKSAPSARRF